LCILDSKGRPKALPWSNAVLGSTTAPALIPNPANSNSQRQEPWFLHVLLHRALCARRLNHYQMNQWFFCPLASNQCKDQQNSEGLRRMSFAVLPALPAESLSLTTHFVHNPWILSDSPVHVALVQELPCPPHRPLNPTCRNDS
jgi:hypothetical protein